MAIHSNGDVYITNPWGPSIFVITHTSDKLELFLYNELLAGINGITISEENQCLYAGGDIGINKIDLFTKTILPLPHGPRFTSYADDGLYFDSNYLYAVQLGLNQVSRFFLNQAGTRIDKCEIIARNGSYLHEPTTGVLVNDYFYFIADTEGKVKNSEGVIIMRAPIK